MLPCMEVTELTEGSQPIVGTVSTIDDTIDLMRSEQKVKCRIMSRVSQSERELVYKKVFNSRLALGNKEVMRREITDFITF
jgi:hypothetical protein